MKPPHQSKVLWFAGILTVLTTLGNLTNSIDVTKLSPQVQEWAVPVFGLVTYLLRRYGSNISVQ